MELRDDDPNEEELEPEDAVITIDLPEQMEKEPLFTTFQIVSREEVQVEVTKYQNQTEYLILASESYTLRIHHGSKVTEEVRSNSDLDWLSQTIRTKYPGIGVQVHRLPVAHDIEQEKIKTVQLFLTFLLEHQLLKNCPEISYFLSETVTYLSCKKEQEAEFIEESTRKGGFSFSTWRAYLKTALPITNHDDSEIDTLLERYQLRELLGKEAGINLSIEFLERLLKHRAKSNEIKASLFRNQTSILQGECEDLLEDTQTVRKRFAQAEQTHKKDVIFDYLHSGIYLQLVHDNLVRYKQMFFAVRSMLGTIALLRHEREFGQMHSRDICLKRLTNNMKRDIDYWLNLNEALLREALTE